MSLRDTIREVQGVLGVAVDGIAGPMTWAAIKRRVVQSRGTAKVRQPVVAGPMADARSEGVIAGLLPEVREYARHLVAGCKERGFVVKVISGMRSYEEQNELYAQGRTKAGAKVTNARGGYSNHNFGLAFDVCIFEGSKPVWESPLYKVVGAIGMDLGLDWGGSWKSFKDEPHFQLRPEWAKGLSERDFLAGLRERKAEGRGAFA